MTINQEGYKFTKIKVGSNVVAVRFVVFGILQRLVLWNGG